MVDTNFEKAASLLTNDGYFDRHRELCQSMGVEQAWRQLEDEMPLELRRYTSFNAFEAAKKRESNGTLSKTVHLKRGGF